jgi:predicted ThiF/HesA family dinucleotide-utilizing enzyme
MKTFVHEGAYRGEDLLRKIAVQSITLCGVGAIGSNLADNLVRQGFQKMAVIDFDRVEEHNRNTQIWNSRDVGQLKVAAIRSHLFNVMKVTVEPIDKKLEASNVRKLLKADSIVIDGFDNPESRKVVMDYCRDNKIDCLHIGLSEDCAEVTWNERYSVPKKGTGIDVCEYPLARNIAMLSVIVGTESLIRFVDTGVKENYLISLRDFKITAIDK